MDAELDSSTALSTANTAVLYLADFRSHSFGKFADHRLFAPSSDVDDSLWCDRDAVTALIENVDRIFASWKDNIKETVVQTLALLKEIEPQFDNACPIEKSRFCYLFGKALNALPQDLTDIMESENEVPLSSQAVQWLTRALKFNPQCADAWCELGESRWRQGDANEAVQHFRQALKVAPNHVEALCELSMALRQLPSSELTSISSTESVESPLNESVRLAHEAVRLEPTNGRAWTVLGNALLTTFFESFAPVAPPPFFSRAVNDSASAEHVAPSASQLIMSRCVAAYALAVKDKSAVLEQSLHYNRGIAWHYQDRFAESLRSWLRAICLDPHWPAPRVIAMRVVEFVIYAYFKMEGTKSKLFDYSTTTGYNQQEEIDVSNQAGEEPVSPQQLSDQVSPLLPCLSLLNDTGLSSNTDDLSSPKPICLTSSQRSSITQLLGPYFSQAKGNLAIGSSPKPSLKKKKSNRSKNPIHPHSPQVPGSSQLQFSLFNDLKIGSNRDAVCVGRVVLRLPSDTELALNLLLVDARCTPLIVRLYNIGKGLGPDRKDILAIPHPFIEQCEVKLCLLRAVLMIASSFGGKDSKIDALLDKLDCLEQQKTDQLSFRILRVPIPDVLVVNGQPVGPSWTAAPVLKNIFFTAV